MSGRFFALKVCAADTEETSYWQFHFHEGDKTVRRVATIVMLALTILALMAAPAMASVMNMH